MMTLLLDSIKIKWKIFVNICTASNTAWNQSSECQSSVVKMSKAVQRCTQITWKSLAFKPTQNSNGNILQTSPQTVKKLTNI